MDSERLDWLVKAGWFLIPEDATDGNNTRWVCFKVGANFFVGDSYRQAIDKAMGVKEVSDGR